MAQVSSRHVLIVDQREAERFAKSDVLRKAGLDVIEADDDASAINALKKHFSGIKVIVLSASLPNTTSNNVLQWIGQNCSSIPVMRPTAAAAGSPEVSESRKDARLGEPVHEVEFVSQVQALLRMQTAEEALQISQDGERQSAAELAAIYDTAPIGLAVISADKRFLLINERLAEITGLPARDHIGRTIREVVPGLAAQAEALIDQIIATGKPMLDVEFKGETPADPGATRTWSSQWQPIRNASGTITSVHVVADDTTKKKNHEQQLRESAEKLKAVLDVLPVGVGLTEKDGSVTLSNAMFRRYVPEYIPSRDEVRSDLWVGKDAEGHRITPENYPGARALRGESVVPGTEFLYHPPDGVPVWTRVAAIPLRSDNGKILGAIAVISDIDREQRALEGIRESELRYRQLFEANPLPMLIFDTETLGILQANTAALELYGYTREEIASITAKDLRPPEDLTAFRQHGASNAGWGLSDEGNWRHCKKDGTILDVEVSSHELEFNGRPARLVMVYDITARKMADDALVQSENRLRLAMEASSTGMWEWDFSTQRISWSPECYTILGLKSETFDGTRLSISQMLHPSDKTRVKTSICEAIEQHTKYDADFRIVRPDGEVRWVSTIGRASYDPDGHPLRMSGTMRDITEKMRIEEHNRILMREVNHRSKNLLAVVQSIANQTSSKGDPRTFALRFSERLQGLAASHDLLVHNKWKGVELADLIASQLAPFRNALKDRITVKGPKFHINVTTAQSLGLALHELVTNAGKYGALSNGEGEVKIGWQVDRTLTPNQFRMTWVESGGPEVKAPNRKGFGTVLLADMIKTSLGATVQLHYAPSGFTWLLEAPVENIVDDDGTTEDRKFRRSSP